MNVHASGLSVEISDASDSRHANSISQNYGMALSQWNYVAISITCPSGSCASNDPTIAYYINGALFM